MNQRRRVGVALAVGIAAGAYALVFRHGRDIATDYDAIWIAGQAMIRGDDPYQAVAARSAWPFYYPLTAAVVGLPLTLIPLGYAGAVFSAIGVGVLAYALTSRGASGLVWLANFPVLEASLHGQWTPLLAAIGLMPSLAWIAVAKPTSGFSVAVGYIHRTATGRAFKINVAIGLVIVVVSLWLWPAWPRDWIDAVGPANQYVALVRRPGGFLLFLAAFRWRRPEGRMILLLACVPQTSSLYEALPLILALDTRREAMVFGVLTCVASLFNAGSSDPSTFPAAMAHNAPINIALVYLPTVLMVLRRPNEGQLPSWTERALTWASSDPGPPSAGQRIRERAMIVLLIVTVALITLQSFQ